jgi:hypothetical protein
LKSTAVAWVWNPVGLRLSTAIKRLDCAPSSLYRPLWSYESQGAKLLATYLEYPAFHFRASKASLCDFLRVSALSPCRNPYPVKNQGIPVGILETPNKIKGFENQF